MKAHAGAHADSCDRVVDNCEEIQARHAGVNWHIAMMPAKSKALDKSTPMGAVLEKLD